jgi:Co/Zn/Cd efflux system component
LPCCGAAPREPEPAGAILHVVGDLLGSIGAIVAALVIIRTG